jgi:hypothetical protein
MAKKSPQILVHPVLQVEAAVAEEEAPLPQAFWIALLPISSSLLQSSYSAHKIALAGNYIYVLDTDGKRLYRLDPGTDTALNIVFDSTYLPTPDVEDMASFNNQLYIRANNGGNYRKLFRVNLSDMTSYYVADMTGSSGQDWPKNFMIYDGSLYFFMNNASGSTRLFHIDTAGGLYESNSYGLEGITTTVVAPSGILMIEMAAPTASFIVIRRIRAFYPLRWG